MTVSNELIDSLLADYKKPEDLIGEQALLANASQAAYAELQRLLLRLRKVSC